MSPHVASLGMYDHSDQRAANDALWSAVAAILRRHGVDAPPALDRSRPVEEIWRDPRLLLAQGCGYPLVSDPTLDLRVVAMPVYDVSGEPSPRHVSHLIVRHDDHGKPLSAYVGRRAAVNGFASNSGCNLFRTAMAPFAADGRVFGAVIDTGSHRASVAAVQTGAADIAAIDAITWAALCRFEPNSVAGLRIIADTASSPTLPFVTAASTDARTRSLLRLALAEAAADPALADVRRDLFLAAIVPASIHRFFALRRLARDAAAAGYPDLR